MSQRATGLTTAALLAGIAAGSVTLTHTPRLVSFAPPAETAELSAAPVVQSRGYAPQATLVKDVMPLNRSLQGLKAKPHLRRIAAPAQPRWIATTKRDMRGTSSQFQPRLTLTVAGPQVHPIYVPAVAQYAALRTPDGWIIIQL